MPLRRVPNPERRNPCTHMTMTRLYDPWGAFKCSLCHKHPNIGWLYRCTQDSGGCLPKSDFVKDDPTQNKKTPAQDVALHTLPTAIIKAIGDGQYTDDQIKTLIQQKEKVQETILAQEPRPATASTATTSSSSTSSKYDTLSTLPESPTFSTNSTASLDEEIRKAYDWKELQNVWLSEPSVPPPDPASPTLVDSHLSTLPSALPTGECTFKICPTCRPTSRERAFQSLNSVLSSPIKLPPIWEFENRRVSDACLLARVHVPPTENSRFYAQTGPRALQSTMSLHTMVGLQHIDSLECHPVDAHSVRKRSGFRQTVRKALARARSEDSGEATEINENDPPYRTSHDASRPSRSLIFRRRRSRPTPFSIESHGRIVDTSGLQDSVMLMLATNTPLPHSPTILFSHSNRSINPYVEHIHDGTNLQISDFTAQS